MAVSDCVRLSREEIETVKKSVAALDQDARLYLFGSRCDPDKRGGDIDILILSEVITPRMLRSVRIDFYRRFGEQKIDLLVDKPQPEKAFVKVILPHAVRL